MIVFVDPRTDEINAPATVIFFARPLPHAFHPHGISRIDNESCHRLSTRGQAFHHRDIQISENRHRDASRDWSSGHHQLMDKQAIIAAFTKGISLLDAKTMLLVDHRQGKVSKEIARVEQGMRSNHNDRHSRGQ